MDSQMESANTYFAPAERANPETLEQLSRFTQNDPILCAIEEAIDGYLLILNPERQVLAANHQIMNDLGVSEMSCLIGNRPGEILGCIHAKEGPGGCGTSKACSNCGAVISILESGRRNEPVEGECLATVKRGEETVSAEFRVRATPVHVGGHTFTILVLNDISSEKRREALERTFFHDILNTVGGLMGWSGLLQTVDSLDPRKAAQQIVTLAQRLTREIQDQRILLQAEKGEYTTNFVKIQVQEPLQILGTIFSTHPAAKGKSLVIDEVDPGVIIQTDSSLLVRVLTNMVKNAMEAIEPGQEVRVWFDRRNNQPVFLVRNPGVIPERVASQIFTRSFSTKGEKGRGIGTYSMKLFGERYLRGRVTFETNEQEGTTFSITLPTVAETQ